MDPRPTWQLVLEQARGLTERGYATFRLADLVANVQQVDPGRARGSIQPVIQGMTLNAGQGPLQPCGKVFMRVGRGWYRLLSDTERARPAQVTRTAGAAEVSVGQPAQERAAAGAPENQSSSQNETDWEQHNDWEQHDDWDGSDWATLEPPDLAEWWPEAVGGSVEAWEHDGGPRLARRSPAITGPSIALRRRVTEVTVRFDELVGLYDQEVPFRRSGQYEFHRRTIDRRRALGSASAAIEDAVFVASLYGTLQKWGIGRRASRLVPLEDFGKRLQFCGSALADLDGLSIEDDALDVGGVTAQIETLINRLGIVENKSLIVAGTKTLHHILPDLVPPMDRRWTGEFFGWLPTDPQKRQTAILAIAYRAFAEIAQAAKPSRLVGAGWRTSLTKLLDNGVIAYCMTNGLTPRGTPTRQTVVEEPFPADEDEPAEVEIIPEGERTVEPAPRHPAAWYPDPDVPNLLRWWDGTGWTVHTHTMPGPPPTWYPDPYGQARLRWWDGRQWSHHTSD
jgi:hypothetical protein